MVVGLIQASFCGGHLAEECAWWTVILVPKGNIEFRNIGMVDIPWKTLMGAQFHNTIHGF